MWGYDCDLTVTDCLIIALLLESAIQSGLLPSNNRYQQIFDATTVPVQIVDRDYQPHYVSAGALPVPEETMKLTEAGTVTMENSLLSSAPIHGGRVVWQDDITQLNELKEQLEDTREQLGEENILLQAELDLKQQRAKADEQNRLYDRIAREVEPQLIKADALLHRIETNPEEIRGLIAKVCVLGSYIKRRGNLLLLGEDAKMVPARELEYCIVSKADADTLHDCNRLFHDRLHRGSKSKAEGTGSTVYILVAVRPADLAAPYHLDPGCSASDGFKGNTEETSQWPLCVSEEAEGK